MLYSPPFTQLLDEFKAEVSILSTLRHPNICLFMGANFTPPNRCIVTELATRGSLWDGLRAPLSPPFAPCSGSSWNNWPNTAPPNSSPPPKDTWPYTLFKRIALGTARGMSYLHESSPPILHRDLKSANLLLDEGYNVKICDFGLARLKALTNSHTGQTGTTQWMAPEVLNNDKYGTEADVYSFGVIMWECLTRECPFEGMNGIQVAMRVLTEGRTVVVPTWCRVGNPKLCKLVESCLMMEPRRRPTFAEILKSFDNDNI